MARSIVVCATCKFAPDTPVSPEGKTGGEILADHLLSAAHDAGDDVQIKAQKCLWSCTKHCNILMRDRERFSYLAGSFEPTRESAEAILEWFRMHDDSRLGQVPFRQWPVAMKGHFIARIPADTGEAGPSDVSEIAVLAGTAQPNT